MQKSFDDLKAQLEAKDEDIAKAASNNKSALEAKDEELAKADAENKAALEAKDAELQTFTVVVSVISGISFCGCGALAVFYLIDKKKRL